ncbi:MAG: hypothetical protein JXB49_31010 [Bacteroidales bacterium]|nr:hypothetical protein [Bacteroidales bacterium]MBN2820730.1 hypothetical protein [Bacteroidales bacterium]
MNGLAKTTIKEFLEFVQEKAKYNVSIIKKNNDALQNYTNSNSDNHEKLKQIMDEVRSKNKQLSEENIILLELHSKILKINDQYGWISSDDLNTPADAKPEPKEEVSIELCVKKAKEGKLELKEGNPCLCKKEIIDAVYKELLTLERYEECQLIKELQSRNEHRNAQGSDTEKILFKLFGMSSKLFGKK